MRLIVLNKGKVAKVDDDDFDRLNRHRWIVLTTRKGTGNSYAVTKMKVNGKKKTVYMHKFVVGDSHHIDHKDGDSLNNQKNNLRHANYVQNGRNRSLQIHSAPFKGVSYFKATGKWSASIRLASHPVQLRKVHLGFFHTPEEAARTYDMVALKHFGDFGRTNEQMGLL